MSNLLLSSQNLVDLVTSWYGDSDGGAVPLSNFTSDIFGKVWRYTPASNVDGSVARFAFPLSAPARASHLAKCRHNASEGGQIRARLGTARLDVDLTDDAELTSPWITFGGGANGMRTNEYGTMVAGGAPRFNHDRRYYDNGFLWSEDLTNAAWKTVGAKVYDAQRVDFAQVGGEFNQVLSQLYNDTYEVRCQVRLESGDGGFQLKIWNGTSNVLSATQTATSVWQWFTVSLAAAGVPTSLNVANAGIVKANGAGLLRVRKLQISRGTSGGRYRKTTTQRRYQRIGVITEASATNSLARSSDFANAAWGKVNATPTSDVATAPDGTVSMDRLTATAGGGLFFQDLSLPGTSARAASVFFRLDPSATTSASIRIDWQTGGVSQFVLCTFNPQTGAFVSSSASGATLRSAGVRDVGEGFYRPYVSGVGTDAANTVVRTELLGNVNGQYVDLWGAQNEASRVTTYIPTTTAAVTRTVDTAIVEASTWLPYVWNAAEGTIYHELQVDDIGSGLALDLMGAISAHSSVGGAQILSRAWWLSPNVQVDVQVYAAGSLQIDGADTAVAPGTVIRQGIRYRASDWATAVNGTIKMTNISVGVPAVTTIDLMNSPGATGYLRRVTIWPTGKSNADLQALTTSGPGAIDYDSGWDDELQMTLAGQVPTNWGQDYDVIKAFSDRSVEWVRIGLYDPAKTTSPTHYFEAGRLFMGALTLQPSANCEYGLEDGWDDATDFVETQSRRRLFNLRPRSREVSFALPYLSHAEGAILHEMDGSGGIATEVLYLPDPSDEAACQRYGFVGLMETLNPLRYPKLNLRGKAYQIQKKR